MNPDKKATHAYKIIAFTCLIPGCSGRYKITSFRALHDVRNKYNDPNIPAVKTIKS